MVAVTEEGVLLCSRGISETFHTLGRGPRSRRGRTLSPLFWMLYQSLLLFTLQHWSCNKANQASVQWHFLTRSPWTLRLIPEYQRLYTNFLLEGLIFAYQQAHHRINNKKNQQCLLFACLFIWSFSSHSRIFHSFWDVTISGEGLQILIYTRHYWQLISEDS